MDQMRAARWQVDIPFVVLARGRASFDLNDYARPCIPFAPRGEELRIQLQKN
jgi:hypothetical protein